MFTNPENYKVVCAIQCVMAKAGIQEPVPAEIINELLRLDELACRPHKAISIHGMVARTIAKWIGDTGSQAVWPQLDLGGVVGKPTLYGKTLTRENLKVIRNTFENKKQLAFVQEFIKQSDTEGWEKTHMMRVFKRFGWEHFQWAYMR